MSRAAVLLDCDGTLSVLEGLDELATRAGIRQKVSELTELAMSGRMGFAAAFAERMKLLQPNVQELAWLADRYIANPVAGAAQAVAALQAAGHLVWVVSSGLQQAIEPFASWLGIKPADVHAVPVIHDKQGRYVGYSSENMIAADKGKKKFLLAQRSGFGKRKLLMVGDGANDADTVDAGAVFIQFAGLSNRQEIAASAHYRIVQPSLSELPALVEQIIRDKTVAERETSDS